MREKTAWNCRNYANGEKAVCFVEWLPLEAFMELHSSEEEPKQREPENEALWRLFEATAPLLKSCDTCRGVSSANPNMDERELHFHHEEAFWCSNYQCEAQTVNTSRSVAE